MEKYGPMRTLTAPRRLKILHLDIETAPNLVYAWGLFKQNVSVNQIVRPTRILCWSAKWHGSREVMYADERRGRRAMLRRMHALISKADALCHYNGVRFDVPRLAQEFRKVGLSPPPPVAQIDLYRTVRSQFALPSNKLEFVAPYFKVGRKQVHPGMSMWVGCENGDPKSWRQMARYNKQDVRLLERLYLRLLPWIKGHPNAGLSLTAGVPACPHCGSLKVHPSGHSRSGTHFYQRFRCGACRAWSRERKNCGPRGGAALRSA